MRTIKKIMTIKRFQQLWKALVTDREPSIKEANPSSVMLGETSETTVKAFVEYGQGNTTAIDNLSKHF